MFPSPKGEKRYPSFLNQKYQIMLRYAIIFFVVALIAGVLGFGGVAAGAAGIAKILFWIFAVLFIISLVSGGLKKV